MTTHQGVASLPSGSSGRIDVAVEIESGYVVVNDSSGEKLGTWRASEIRAKLDRDSRVVLKAGRQKFLFETSRPDEFMTCLEQESQGIEGTPPEERMRQASRLGTIVNQVDEEVAESGEGFETKQVPSTPSRAETLLRPLPHEPRDVVQPSGNVPSQSGRHVSKRALRNFIVPVQADVVSALALGMKAWFGFYFKLGDGTGQQRLRAAATGLQQGAAQLRRCADLISDRQDHFDPKALGTYSAAVADWARALDMIAEGVELDNQSAARRGLSILTDASDSARTVLRRSLFPSLGLSGTRSAARVEVRATLAYAKSVSPPAKVSRSVVADAKRPWKKAVVAAGSPFPRL